MVKKIPKHHKKLLDSDLIDKKESEKHLIELEKIIKDLRTKVDKKTLDNNSILIELDNIMDIIKLNLKNA